MDDCIKCEVIGVRPRRHLTHFLTCLLLAEHYTHINTCDVLLLLLTVSMYTMQSTTK